MQAGLSPTFGKPLNWKPTPLYLPICPCAPLVQFPASLGSRWLAFRDVRRKKTRSILAVLGCAAEPSTRGHVYFPHKARPTTLRRPHHLQAGQETCVSENEVPTLLSSGGLQPPCCAAHPTSRSLTAVPAAAAPRPLGEVLVECSVHRQQSSSLDICSLALMLVQTQSLTCYLSDSDPVTMEPKRLGTAVCTWAMAIRSTPLPQQLGA